MVSRPLIISLILVGAFAVADKLGTRTSSQIGDQSSADSQTLSAKDVYRVAGGNTVENPLARYNLEDFGVISERTLFSPSRRAPVAVQSVVEVPVVQEVSQVAPPPPAPDPGDFTLLGVVVGSTDRVALLRWNKTNEMLRLRLGANYSGWKIVEINSRNVLIEQGDAQFSLQLFKAASGENAMASQD